MADRPMLSDGALAVTGDVDNAGDATRPSKPIDCPMHVKLNHSSGRWCRLLPQSPLYQQIDLRGAHTGCGKQVTGYYGTRAECMNGEPLCEDGCFSRFELRINDAIRISEVERCRLEAELAEREFEARARERADDIEEGRKRVETSTGQRRLVDLRDEKDEDPE